jgi:RNA polymerase sigma-70 factor, ECF subfamily
MANESYLGDAISEFARVTRISSAQPDADVALVRACQRGDREAFGHLYQRYVPMVHGILLSKLPPPEVEDLVHEVFLRALSRLRSLRDASRFGGWLAAITRNMANDYYREPHAKIRPGERDADDTTDAGLGANPSNQTEQRDATEILEIIRTLPEAYRETLVLRLVEGLTGPEIAARTGLSHGSVRVNLYRGMQQLRERLDRKRTLAGSSK